MTSIYTSIYSGALGSDFARLHPQIQRRFGFSSADRTAAIGRGVMERLWHGPPYTLPFLYVGSFRRILFPEQGSNVPFTIENYAYRDPLGRETVTWIRTFETTRCRRFDAYMIYSRDRGRIVDYLGTHQHLAVDIDLSVDERGGLRLRSGRSASMRARSGSRSRCSSPASPTCASGSTTARTGSASKSTSATICGGRSSAIGAGLRWSGAMVRPAPRRRTSFPGGRSGGSDGPRLKAQGSGRAQARSSSRWSKVLPEP